MAPTTITREDLNNLESKIKQDLTQQEIANRHSLANQVQKGFNMIDDHGKELQALSKDVALSNQFIRTMKTDFDGMKLEIKDDFDEIKNTLKSMSEHMEKNYASKWVEKIMIFIGSTAGGVIIISFLYLILKK